jgi:hypothetical protein
MAHLAASFGSGNAVHASHPPTLYHKLEFQQQGHSAENIKTGKTTT